MNEVMDPPANLPSTKSGNGIQKQAHGVTLGEMLTRRRDLIAAVLPKHMTPERLIKLATVAVSRVPQLANCSLLSVVNAVMKSAELGLDCSGTLGSAYLVPFGKEATLIIGYRGLIDLARRSGQIASVEARIVYEGDGFEYEFGLEQKLVHRPTTAKRGEMKSVYAVARLRDGSNQFEVMDKSEVDAIRRRSRSSSNGPWVTDYCEMARKTVVKRLCKYLPLSVEIQEAIAEDNQADPIDIVGDAQQTATDRLNAKLVTSKPVSEGQTFEPTPEAVNEALAEASDSHVADESTAGADPIPDVQSPQPPQFSNYEGFRLAMTEAAIDANIPETALWKQVGDVVLAAGAKGKESKIKVETLREWYASFVAGEEPFKR